MNARLRFEVFKRDKFQCQYCGRGIPSVMLECDHIVPQAVGGTDDIGNLTTSCVECNQGKKDRLLPEGVRPAIDEQSVAALRERVEQTKAYHSYLEELQQLEANATDRIWKRWTEAFGGTVHADGYHCAGGFPSERTVRYFVGSLPLDQILDAIDITAGKLGPGWRAQRYFYAICHNRIRDRRGGA